MPLRENPNPRFAYGEYVTPEPKGSAAVWRARLDLMEAVQRVHPAMLQRLLADVFPAYKALAETGFDFDAILWNSRLSPFTELGAVDLTLFDLRARIRAAEPASSEASSNPMPSDVQIAQATRDGDFRTYERLMNEKQAAAYRRRRQITSKVEPEAVLRKCAALRDALKAWGTAFNADVLWFLDETLRTLRGWYVAPDWRDALRWNPLSGVSSTIAYGEKFSFACEGWEMQLLPWADYRRLVRDRFEKYLAEYEAAARKSAKSRGLVRVPHKSSPANLEWFALYQFVGLSSKGIADRPNFASDPDAAPDESTILKGVKAAARRIGWDSLRPTRGRLNRKIR